MESLQPVVSAVLRYMVRSTSYVVSIYQMVGYLIDLISSRGDQVGC